MISRRGRCRVVDAEADVARDFAPLAQRALGVFLYGSHAAGRAHARSDVDVCVVAGPGLPAEEAQREAWRIAGPYDVRVFEDMPLWLQGQVLKGGKLVLARDPAALHDYLRPRWKQGEHERRRIRLSPDELQRLLDAREAMRS